MIKLLQNFTGPSEYVFQDPDTGRSFRADTRAELRKQIIDYRQQNRLPKIESLDYVLEMYWCGLPENTGRCREVRLKRGWSKYLRGGIALLENLYYGEQNMVSQSVADSRSAICLKCPHNVFPDKGPFLQWSDNIADACTFGKKAKHHNDLGNCEICSCPLRAKVWYAGELDLTTDELKQMPDFCWQKQAYDSRKPS